MANEDDLVVVIVADYRLDRLLLLRSYDSNIISTVNAYQNNLP